MSNSDIALYSFYVGYFGTLSLIMLVFSLIRYILTGKSLSAIARRRGIEKPWLAWVPVGCDWLLGCVSDQYRYVSYGEETNRRGKLMWYNICLTVVVSAIFALAILTAVLGNGGASEEQTTFLGMLIFILYFAMLPLLVLYNINYYKSCYDLFRSCNPNASLVFLLVSIFAVYPQPFFLYSCRNKDLGMPPRTAAASLTEAE